MACHLEMEGMITKQDGALDAILPNLESLLPCYLPKCLPTGLLTYSRNPHLLLLQLHETGVRKPLYLVFHDNSCQLLF